MHINNTTDRQYTPTRSTSTCGDHLYPPPPVSTHPDGAPEPPNVCCSALERGLADLRCLANEHNERRATAFGQLFDAVRQRAQAPDEEAKAASTATAVSLLSQLAYDIGGVGQDVLLTVAVHVQSQHNVDELLAQGASPLMRVAHFSTLQVAVFLQQYTMLEHMLQSLTCACSAAPDAPLMRCTDITEGASHCLCCDDAAPEVRVAYGKADCAAVRTELMAALITATLLGDLDACGVLVKSMQRFRGMHMHARTTTRGIFYETPGNQHAMT